jgi:hypothetical protein
MATDIVKTPGVDVQVLSAMPGSVTTLDATSVATYPSHGQPMPGSAAGGVGPGVGPGWAPSWPMMMPQTPVIVVTVDKKPDDKNKGAKTHSEVFKRP